MRITNSTILRGYNRDLNRLLNLKTQTEKRITSGRKFARASEAPLSAAKALNVRKSLYYSAQYKENLKVADKFYTEAETSLLQVSTKMADIRETIIAACNTTKDMQDYNIYAQQLETSARELCAIFNTDSAGRAIFGGESDDPSPFEIINDANGNASTVLYHGIPVNAMDDYTGFPFSKDVNMDIGLGMDMDQKTQEVDPQSVLRISFNGAKVSGCGAERGVADIDLSSIKESRTYCLDVYADNVKKTITFIGQANYKDNVDVINKALEEAYMKEVNNDIIKQPKMDDQGVISVEDGICCVVNNDVNKNPKYIATMVDGEPGLRENTNKIRTEALTVENDSGYTNKFKVNLENLVEGQDYTLNITIGDETKSITFTAGMDDFSDPENPKYREEFSLDNIQAALDEAFGTGPDRVSISRTEASKGVITCEGKRVKVGVIDTGTAASDTKTAAIDTVSSDKINLNAVKHDDPAKVYSLGVTVNNQRYEISFAAGEKESDTIANIEQAIKDKVGGTFSVVNTGDKKGVITTADGTAVALSKAENTPDTESLIPSKYTEYSVDVSQMNEGEKYALKVVSGSSVSNIEFTAGATEQDTVDAITKALNGTKVNVALDDGNAKFSSADGKGVSVAVPTNSTTENRVVERESIYSNNYIQLTLDAARALRNGDIEYANGCIDRIVSANENLLVEIADLGCNEEFISFNIDRITTREENLQERQVDLEATDAKSEITLWKTYEAMYNACLQMSSSVVPNSIFNYIK